jgi:hypothetical protein
MIRHKNLIQWDPFEVIYRADDNAEEAYLITEGDAKILSKDGVLLGVVKPQSILGDFAVINKCQRTVSAMAGAKGMKAKVVMSSKFDGISQADSLDRFLLLQTQERLVAADNLIADTSLQLENLSGDAKSISYKKVLEGAKYSEVRHELNDLAKKLKQLSSNPAVPQYASENQDKHTFKQFVDKAEFETITSVNTIDLLAKLEPDDWIEINNEYRIIGILKRAQKLKLELNFLEFLTDEVKSRIVSVDVERQLVALAVSCEPEQLKNIKKELFISPVVYQDDRYYHLFSKIRNDTDFVDAVKSNNSLKNEHLISVELPNTAKVYRQFEHRRFKLPEHQLYDTAHALVSDQLEYTIQLLEVSMAGGFICLQYTDDIKFEHGMQLGLAIQYAEGDLRVDTYIKNVLSNSFSDLLFIEVAFISEEPAIVFEITKFVRYIERMLIIDEKSDNQ